MPVPVFVYHEILIRMQNFNPQIGDYLSASAHGDAVSLQTTTGSLSVPVALLQSQFRDPSAIDDEELRTLAGNFGL
ncbi:hypothetical protein [Pedobacter sp. SYP-B3415]|uniref:hypothetical protein n=1 Tax=Pedobacter sp. SYP-B3415 TaxID=2496641 RepID=UPI00101BE891|nr:hypothetical protein [Pedobacter sp. SYP-B3415]